jgi:hypothetical protein
MGQRINQPVHQMRFRPHDFTVPPKLWINPVALVAYHGCHFGDSSGTTLTLDTTGRQSTHFH